LPALRNANSAAPPTRIEVELPPRRTIFAQERSKRSDNELSAMDNSPGSPPGDFAALHLWVLESGFLTYEEQFLNPRMTPGHQTRGIRPRPSARQLGRLTGDFGRKSRVK
jgi:hypothetical protein